MECQLKGTTIYYEQYGEGKPVILLHGRPVDHRHMVKDFEPIFESRNGWKRIYPDMPGMGRSPGPDWMNKPDQMLDVMVEFIDNVIPNQHFCVGGTSYGGYMAQGIIYRRPEMIDGAFLMSPSVVDDEDRNLPEHVTLVEDPKLLSSLSADEAEFFQGFAVVQSRELLESLRTDVLPAFEIADHDFLNKFEDHFSFTFDVRNLPQPMEKPVLILLGRQDSVTGYKDAWDLLENYPRASFVVLDRGGHGLGVEQKSLFRILTNEWIDRVEENARLNT